MSFSYVVLLVVAAVVAASAAPPTTSQPATASAAESEATTDYPAPQIDWGKCPQLKPTESDKEQKRLVIQKCLDQNPPPALETITNPQEIDNHREVVTTCALKTEGWFNDDGSYKFDRAKTEIESKKLESTVEKNISDRHQECQVEAVKRFPDGYIQQVQLYQACMDYHIAEICEIELIPPPGGFPTENYEALGEADYNDEIEPQAFPAFPSAPQPSAEPEKAT